MVDFSSAERPFLTSLAGRDVHIRVGGGISFFSPSRAMSDFTW